jgi:hypothetical protein
MFVIDYDIGSEKMPPTLPSDTKISFSNVTDKGFTISWKVAIDPVTPASKLRYRVCIYEVISGATFNIPTCIDLIGVTSHTFSGLKDNTEFSVYVAVYDERNNNYLLYPTVKQKTNKTDTVEYVYDKQWPEDRENGWSEELNGVCHDNDNWFFTQNGVLWKFPVAHNLKAEVKSANIAKGIGRNKYGHHLGDFDCYKGYLFIPVTGNGSPYFAVFSANDLSLITTQPLQRNGSHFESLGWCAINPKDGRLYTSDKHAKNTITSNSTPIRIYDIDIAAIQKKSGDFLKYRASLILKDEKGNALTREHMQGGCFDNENHLHIANGYQQMAAGQPTWANDKGGISVFTVPDSIAVNATYSANRITHSEQKGTFRFQFDGIRQEPQGITYWDLNTDNRAPEIRGVLHAIMLDNLGTGDDDFYFKHYNRILPNTSLRVDVFNCMKDENIVASGWFTKYGDKGKELETVYDLQKGNNPTHQTVGKVTSNLNTGLPCTVSLTKALSEGGDGRANGRVFNKCFMEPPFELPKNTYRVHLRIRSRDNNKSFYFEKEYMMPCGNMMAGYLRPGKKGGESVNWFFKGENDNWYND